MENTRMIRTSTTVAPVEIGEDVLFELKDFNVAYRMGKDRVYACQDINLQVRPRTSIGIVGESGSGKSTLVNAFLRLIPERIAEITGEALLQGEDLMRASKERMADLRWKEISVVFQKSMNSLSPVHRVGDQLEDVYRVHHPSASKREIRQRLLELFEVVSLPPRILRSFPHELSGGMMQRISIALSLLFDVKLLVLDEATTALDVVTQSQILQEVIRMEDQMDLTRLMITHDISVVASTCREIAVMYAGRIMEQGLVTEVLVDPKHPYTQGLLGSFPTLTGERREVEGIPGSLPRLTEKFTYCPFADRCPEVMPICREVLPPATQHAQEQAVYCHLYTEGAANA